jgi:hypothetical protein
LKYLIEKRKETPKIIKIVYGTTNLPAACLLVGRIGRVDKSGGKEYVVLSG